MDMHTDHIATVVFGISSMVLLLQASVVAQQTPVKRSEARTIVFVCEHGSAKSVIAAAHFDDLAKKNGLPYRALARGVHPDEEIPSYIRGGLASEGLDIRGWQPKQLSKEDVQRAERVVALGCTLPGSKSVKGHELENWNDVPSPSKNYQEASRTISERVALLVGELASKQTAP